MPKTLSSWISLGKIAAGALKEPLSLYYIVKSIARPTLCLIRLMKFFPSIAEMAKMQLETDAREPKQSHVIAPTRRFISLSKTMACNHTQRFAALPSTAAGPISTVINLGITLSGLRGRWAGSSLSNGLISKACGSCELRMLDVNSSSSFGVNYGDLASVP